MTDHQSLSTVNQSIQTHRIVIPISRQRLISHLIDIQTIRRPITTPLPPLRIRLAVVHRTPRGAGVDDLDRCIAEDGGAGCGDVAIVVDFEAEAAGRGFGGWAADARGGGALAGAGRVEY